MNLRVTSTSLLPARSPAWRPLEEVADLEFGGYGDWPEVLTSGDPDGAVALVVFLEDLLPWKALRQGGAEARDAAEGVVTSLLQALDRRLARSVAPTLVAWLGGHPESPIRLARNPTPRAAAAARLGLELQERTRRHPALYQLSLDGLFAPEGLLRCLDSRNFQATRCRLSLTGLKTLARGLRALAGRLQRPARKVLVLDCDNTLWGGVVGEVGVGGLDLGQDGLGSAFVAFQQAVKALAGNGTVLAISSKNEEADVRSVFESHPGMVVRWEDFSACRVDWREKAVQLAEIAADLDLGMDSLVFWDDNPVEREKVRVQLPQVLVPEPPPEVIDWPGALLALDELAWFEASAEDARKTEQYRARAAFQGEVRGSTDVEAFLAGIGMVPQLVEIAEPTRGRAVQLCAKTNQFNLRLERHDEAALVGILRQEGSVGFLASLADRFGDHGQVGLVLARPTPVPGVAFLDTFLLSCRVLGRHLEAWMLEQLRRRLRAAGYRILVARFVPGERNRHAEPFLREHGMVDLGDPACPEELRALAGEAAGEAPSPWLHAALLEEWQIPHLEIFAS